MQLFHPIWLNAFWLIGLVVLFYLWAARRKRAMLNKFADASSLAHLAPARSRAKEFVKKGLLLLTLSLLIMSLTQPQWGNVKREIQRKGVEIVFLVDTSLSMLSEDMSPNRIEKAKLEMRSFLKVLQGDRVGIVTFAGTGFIQSPLTLDYDAFRLFANSIEVGYIPNPGTSLNKAIETAILSFPESQKKHQAIILMSDGEHQEGDVQHMVEIAKEAGVRIYTLGFGTAEGAPIPLRSEDGKVGGYKKDRAGNVVITKLNQSLLEQIAKETGGVYSPATPAEKEVDWFYRHMADLDQIEFKERVITEREDHFQLFLGIAMILLLIEFLLGEVKRRQRVEA